MSKASSSRPPMSSSQSVMSPIRGSAKSVKKSGPVEGQSSLSRVNTTNSDLSPTTARVISKVLKSSKVVKNTAKRPKMISLAGFNGAPPVEKDSMDTKKTSMGRSVNLQLFLALNKAHPDLLKLEGGEPAKVMIDGVFKPTWFISDRNRENYLLVVQYIDFHDPLTSTSCSVMNGRTMINRTGEGNKDDITYTDLYRGAIFKYGLQTSNGKCHKATVNMIYTPSQVYYKYLGADQKCEVKIKSTSIEGTILKIFKLDGVVHFSTSSYVDTSYSTHRMCPDYRKIYEMLGGPTIESPGGDNALFDSDIQSSKMIYIFKLNHPATGQLSSIIYRSFIEYLGSDTINIEAEPYDERFDVLEGSLELFLGTGTPLQGVYTVNIPADIVTLSNKINSYGSEVMSVYNNIAYNGVFDFDAIDQTFIVYDHGNGQRGNFWVSYPDTRDSARKIGLNYYSQLQLVAKENQIGEPQIRARYNQAPKPILNAIIAANNYRIYASNIPLYGNDKIYQNLADSDFFIAEAEGIKDKANSNKNSFIKLIKPSYSRKSIIRGHSQNVFCGIVDLIGRTYVDAEGIVPVAEGYNYGAFNESTLLFRGAVPVVQTQDIGLLYEENGNNEIFRIKLVQGYKYFVGAYAASSNITRCPAIYTYADMLKTAFASFHQTSMFIDGKSIDDIYNYIQSGLGRDLPYDVVGEGDSTKIEIMMNENFKTKKLVQHNLIDDFVSQADYNRILSSYGVKNPSLQDAEVYLDQSGRGRKGQLQRKYGKSVDESVENSKIIGLNIKDFKEIASDYRKFVELINKQVEFMKEKEEFVKHITQPYMKIINYGNLVGMPGVDMDADLVTSYILWRQSKLTYYRFHTERAQLGEVDRPLKSEEIPTDIEIAKIESEFRQIKGILSFFLGLPI